RPHDGAASLVEDVHDPRRPQRVHATVAEGRRRARTGAGVRLPEPGGVAVLPHRLAGGRLVARHHLVLAALLLGEEAVAVDREGRPARPDRPAPRLDRRGRGPVGLDPDTGDDAVAMGAAEAGPLGLRRRRFGGRRWRGGRRALVAGGGHAWLF